MVKTGSSRKEFDDEVEELFVKVVPYSMQMMFKMARLEEKQMMKIHNKEYKLKNKKR